MADRLHIITRRKVCAHTVTAMYPLSSRFDIVMGPADGQRPSPPKAAKASKGKTPGPLPAVDPQKDGRTPRKQRET